MTESTGPTLVSQQVTLNDESVLKHLLANRTSSALPKCKLVCTQWLSFYTLSFGFVSISSIHLFETIKIESSAKSLTTACRWHTKEKVSNPK